MDMAARREIERARKTAHAEYNLGISPATLHPTSLRRGP